MQIIQQPISYSSIQGDPASRVFGFVFLGTLSMITIGVIVGITAGNIAHYEYFGPSNVSNISNITLLNKTIFQQKFLAKDTQLWLSLDERLKRTYSSRKTRQSWSFEKKPTNNRRW